MVVALIKIWFEESKYKVFIVIFTSLGLDGFTFFVYVSVGSYEEKTGTFRFNGNPKWGGALKNHKRRASKLIEIQHADQWCKDNGYPLQKRKYVYRGKWVLKDPDK